MTSSRNNPTRADEDLLLDAARDRITAVGLRRATLTDIARRAGVSRMTIYRRWPDMAALVGDVMTREWVGLIGTVGAAATGAHTRERLVTGVVEGVRTMREHPMFRRIVDLDPEVLLPYLVDRRGASQDAMLAQISAGVAAGQADGSVRAGDVAVLAQSVLLTLQSFALSAPIMGGDLAELDAELATLLDRYLAADGVPS
ncbi:TetR/AcrR family transcriptional regulator [Longispora sp. K20-0274]|uniref:TetR/AcrR family transcriptional regulator n=1 Tax=Longispora sp. K20-0274 TaxID=3088255 RepID=UPI00399A6FF9